MPTAASRTASRPSAAVRSPWIVAAWWDLAYIVATPLAIVPLVWWLVERVVTPEVVSLSVMAFATLGHHLPGFMRAYGDRDLFQRFRGRFVLAPPAIFVVALIFAAPAVLTVSPGDWLRNRDLLLSQPPWHALELATFFWATWHGLMQTYGFMRIYDVKRGVSRPRSGQLDLALCIAIFAAGVAWSDARAYKLVETLAQCGLPLVGATGIAVVRWLVGGATAAIVAAYVVDMVRARQETGGVNVIKLLLAATTGGLYWFAGLTSTNLLIGVAMFEIFHAVQYYAIVWIYNRSLAQRSGAQFGPLGFMFRDRWTMVGLYLAAIALFGGVRWLTDGIDNQAAQILLMAVYTTSTILHFYYDGFIWKVRERKTQVNLDAAAPTARVEQVDVPVWKHLAKWGALAAIVAGLVVVQRRSAAESTPGQLVSHLAACFPELPEAQQRESRRLLGEGDVAGAIAAAEKAVPLRRRSHDAHADLGAALLADGQWQAALDELDAALALAPRHWEYHSKRATALLALGRTDDALAQYREGLTHQPGATLLRSGLVQTLITANDRDGALSEAQALVADQPRSATAQLALAAAQTARGRLAQALTAVRRAIELDPNFDAAHLRLGKLLIAKGDVVHGIEALRTAVDLNPHNTDAAFEVGVIFLQHDYFRDAISAFERAARSSTRRVAALANLGSAWHGLGDLPRAEEHYRAALQLDPRHANSHYNLGLILLQRGAPYHETRSHFVRAQELGQPPTEQVRAMFGL